jgi:YD repeat-containing protein
LFFLSLHFANHYDIMFSFLFTYGGKKMKKIISITLLLALAVAVFAGCAGPKNASPTPTPSQNNGSDNGSGSAEGIVKLGLGQLVSIASSKNAEGDNGAVAQVDTIIAAVGFDKDGKVASVTIDNAQTRVNYDKEGNMTSDPSAELKTKVELGDDYGMKARSGIGKEWFEQIAELEKWMVGKTVDEIKGMKTKEVDAGHPAVPDDPELTSLVTISIQDYIAVVVEAWEKAVDVESAEKVGLGINVSIAKSKGADGENGPIAQVDTVMAATAITSDNKTAGTLIDNAQIKVTFDKAGQLTSDPAAELKTKVELGDAYGMKGNSGINKEWFEQIAELGSWMKGKTIDEIKNMKTKEVDAAHPAVPDDPDLTSLVTISVQDYIAAVSESFDRAK